MRSLPGSSLLPLPAIRAFAVALCVLLPTGAPVTAAAPAADVTSAAPTLVGAPLRNALRNGGYVLYFRHTATDFGQNDEKMTGYEDCTHQRNLTAAGRAEARAIGAAIRSLDVPIGDVLASPFCRTRETAELIFGRAKTAPAVRGGPAQADPERYAELKLLFVQRVPGGVNLALVGHGNPFVAVAGGPYLAEGEAAVIEPRDSDGFHVVARVRKDQWTALQ